MDVIKDIGKISLVILCLIAIVIDVLFVYYRFIDPSRTLGVNFIGDQIAVDAIQNTDDLTDEKQRELEERLLYTINLYDNTNENGLFLAEMQMNYFMTPALLTADYRSSGWQIVVNNADLDKYLDFIDTDFNIGYSAEYADFYSELAFETTDGVSWAGKISEQSVMTGLERNTEYIIKIDNEAYSISLTGTYKKWEPLWGFLWNVENTYEYTFKDIFSCLLYATQSNSEGEGSCYITPDLSNYFTVKKYNTESKRFETLEYVDILKNYATIKINYSKDGVKNSTQSLFGVIANNPSFDLDNKDISTEYWTAGVTYILDETDLTYRYSEQYQGYFASVSQDMITRYANMPKTIVYLRINLDSVYLSTNNINIVGFDYYGFQHFDMYSLSITSVNSHTLTLLDYCLDDTNLTELRYSSSIKLVKSDTAITSELKEVII